MEEVSGLTDRYYGKSFDPLASLLKSKNNCPSKRRSTQSAAVVEGLVINPRDSFWAAASGGYSLSEELRFEVLKDVLQDAFLEYPCSELFHAGRTALQIQRRLTSGRSGYHIRDCLREDLLSGNSHYPVTTVAVQRALSFELGKDVAAFVIKEIIKKDPVTGVIALLLGPEFIESAVYDLPRSIRNAGEITGFSLENGSIRFNWRGKGGYSIEDEKKYKPYLHVEKQRGWSRSIRPILKKLGSFLRICFMNDARKAKVGR